MTRTHTSARTSAIAALVALSAVLGVAPSAFGQGEIPLQDVISPQYQVPGADVAADTVAAVAEAAPAPAPPAAPEPPETVAPEPQYQAPDISDNSEDVTQKAPPEPPADPPAPDPPAPVDPPAPPAHADAPEAPAPGGDGSQPDIEAALPDLEAVVPDLDAAVPDLDAPPPAADTVAPVAPVTGGGNTNISIRIFSPGDNGPVNQAGGGGTTPAAPDTTPAPTTWIWNWTWNGSPDCLPAPPGNVAPPGLGDWTWTWTWTCDGAIPVRVPGGGVVPAIPPGLDDALPGIEIAAGVLPPVVPVDAFEIAAQVAPVSLPDALPSPLAAGRRTPARADALVEPHPAPAPLRPAAASAPVMPATTVPASPEPAQERAARRHRDRDTTRGDGLVSAPVSPAGVAIAAASGAAAAAGSAPAVLTLTLTVLAAFLASALLQIAGLPRLLLRAARLERPG